MNPVATRIREKRVIEGGIREVKLRDRGRLTEIPFRDPGSAFSWRAAPSSLRSGARPGGSGAERESDTSHPAMLAHLMIGGTRASRIAL